jgi:hypothetical protein
MPNLPDPQLSGVTLKRDVAVCGIQLNDHLGNELGGFGMIDGTRAGVLALDYSKREAVALYSNDDPDRPAAGLMINARMKKGPLGEGDAYRRIELRVEGDLPALVFKGKDGRDRIIIGLDEEEDPVVEVVGKDGERRSLIE